MIQKHLELRTHWVATNSEPLPGLLCVLAGATPASIAAGMGAE